MRCRPKTTVRTLHVSLPTGRQYINCTLSGGGTLAAFSFIVVLCWWDGAGHQCRYINELFAEYVIQHNMSSVQSFSFLLDAVFITTSIYATLIPALLSLNLSAD